MKSITFDVAYTDFKGKENHVLVKAQNKNEALENAKYQCYTGKDFRNAKVTNEPYSTPRQNGYQGSERQ